MNELTTTDNSAQTADPAAATTFALMMSSDGMDRVYKVAETMAAGVATMPAHLRGKPADCFAVALQAVGWSMNPFAVAQKTHLTQGGSLGYEAQLINAVITTRAPIKARPDYEFIGNWDKILGKVEERKSDKGGKYYVATWKDADEQGLGVIVRCTLKGESLPRELKLMLTQCYPRFSTQWATDPQQQITYAAVRKWSRRYTPDVILGVYTKDELDGAETLPRDMGAADVVEPSKPTGLSVGELAAWKAEAGKGMQAAQAHWKLMGKDLRAKATEAQQLEMKALAEKADQARTVDNTPPADAVKAAPATPATTDSTDEFVAAMERAEGAAK